jgi:hypothetical protein
MKPQPFMGPMGILLVFSIVFSGCMSGQNHPVLEEALNQATKGQAPLVEAFIEYGGPDEKWIGPTPFLLRVEAKGVAEAKIEVTNKAFKVPIPLKPVRLSTELTRDELLEFSLALENQVHVEGCLYPIRIRLVRASGVVVEKQGCRGQKEFSKHVSKRVNDWMNAAYYGASPKLLAADPLKGTSKQPAPRSPSSARSEE